MFRFYPTRPYASNYDHIIVERCSGPGVACNGCQTCILVGYGGAA